MLQYIIFSGVKKKTDILKSEGERNKNACANDSICIYLDDITNSASSVSDNGLYSIENDVSSPTSPVQTPNENCQTETSPDSLDLPSSDIQNNEDRQITRDDQESNQLNDIACTKLNTLNELQDASKQTEDNNDIIELSLEDTNSSLHAKLTISQIGCEIMEKSYENFHCNQCRKQFSSETKLNAHVEQHSNPSLQCKQCSYTTTSSKLLKYHLNIHSEKFKCSACDKLFTRKVYLKYHVKNVHRKTRRFHNCEECSAKFLSLSGLKMHIQSAHEQDGYPCSLCGYIGKNTNALSCHVARSHRKKYKCSSCNYESLTQGGLDRHEKIYHNPNDRQYACKHCSYRGQKQRQLADHEKTVHGHAQNRHMCPVCKKSFRTQVMMKHHLPSHSDQPLYSCKGCNYRTRFRQTLYLHIKNTHPGETFKTMGEGPSDANFQEIIDTALQNLEPYLPCEEQNMEVDYLNQVPEDSGNFLNVPVHASNAVTCTEEVSNSQILTLEQYKSNPQVLNNTLVNHKVDDLNEGIMQSDHAVAVINSSGELQTVVNLTGKKEVQSLFPLKSFHFKGSKIQQVVTLVDGLEAVEDTNEQTVMLLDNVVEEKTAEHRTVTHISLVNNQSPAEENLVILPLGDSNVAIIQNENFANVQADNPLVLGHQTTLLDLIPEQSEIIHNQTRSHCLPP